MIIFDTRQLRNTLSKIESDLLKGIVFCEEIILTVAL